MPSNPKGGKVHGRVCSDKTVLSSDGVHYADSRGAVRLAFEDKLELANFSRDSKSRPCPFRSLFKEGCTSDKKGSCKRCGQGAIAYVERKPTTSAVLALFKGLEVAKELR